MVIKRVISTVSGETMCNEEYEMFDNIDCIKKIMVPPSEGDVKGPQLFALECRKKGEEDGLLLPIQHDRPIYVMSDNGKTIEVIR